jgi:hypothetical protein
MSHEEMVHLPTSSHPSGNGTSKTVKRTNWKRVAKKLEEDLEVMKLRHQELTHKLAEVTEHAPALAEREAIKLRRLHHFVGRVVNAPFCDSCREWFDKVHEQEIKCMRETIDESRKAMGG